ncbi:hypothetical protein [Luedemannella flava]
MTRMIGRLGAYGFCLMFVAIGCGLPLFRRDREGLLGALGFVVGGLLLMAFLFALHRWQDGREAILRAGIPGRGTVVAARKLKMAEDWDQFLKVTLVVEIPGRPPYRADVRKPYHRTYIDSVVPGLVVPVRVSPRNPNRVLIATTTMGRPI